MKILSASLLFCAMMALTRAAAVPEADPDAEAGPLTNKGDSNLVKSSGRCPADWTSNNRRCFRYISTRMSWDDAERHCQNQGGHLASVHSPGEYSFIKDIIWRAAHAYPTTWLGGSDSQREGVWFWSDGTRFDFTNWAPKQPDNYFNEDCLVMNFGGQLKFGDSKCSSRNPLICARWQ